MYLTYLRRELRRRSKQAIVVAVGLAVGIGLVMTVSAASAGVKDAQGAVLQSLYGVGTNLTVTKTATAGSGGPQHFSGFSNGNSSRPSAGTTISRDTLRPTPGESTLPAADVSKVASLDGTAAATGGLELTDTSFSGTIPSSSSSGGSFFGSGSSSTSGGSTTGGAGSSFNISSFTVDGVQIVTSGSGVGVGPLAASEVTQGSYFSSTDNTADAAVVTASYATQEGLKVGSTVDVAGKDLSVIGIADVSSNSADVFIPLGTAQSLSGLTGDVTTIYVSASSASEVSKLASEAQTALPGTTVTTSASLASDVSGSLSSAAKLATSLGKWLSIAALAVAFAVAGLLMMATVSRRVRELGTLKAIGWRTRRIVAQVVGEGLALGIAGGLAGIVLGIAGAEIVSAVAPSLSTTVPNALTAGGFTGGSPGSGSARNPFSATKTVLVHLSAPLHGETVLVAVLLAAAGGLVAGGFGAWRAARLRPAAALRRIE
jgi:putative ABC transport system permease protein